MIPNGRSQCTYRCVVLPDVETRDDKVVYKIGLNAPTGAWCSLTGTDYHLAGAHDGSQCTYRCVVLPDFDGLTSLVNYSVSMHLQVRGAP